TIRVVGRRGYKRTSAETGADLRAWLFTIMHLLNVNEVRRAIRDEQRSRARAICRAHLAVSQAMVIQRRRRHPGQLRGFDRGVCAGERKDRNDAAHRRAEKWSPN